MKLVKIVFLGLFPLVLSADSVINRVDLQHYSMSGCPGLMEPKTSTDNNGIFKSTSPIDNNRIFRSTSPKAVRNKVDNPFQKSSEVGSGKALAQSENAFFGFMKRAYSYIKSFLFTHNKA